MQTVNWCITKSVCGDSLGRKHNTFCESVRSRKLSVLLWGPASSADPIIHPSIQDGLPGDFTMWTLWLQVACGDGMRAAWFISNPSVTVTLSAMPDVCRWLWLFSDEERRFAHARNYSLSDFTEPVH